MTTKETVKKYFDAIHMGGWEDFVADDFVFINANLDNVAHGKQAYLEGAGRFFKTTNTVELKQIIIQDDKVAVLARYNVRSPKGQTGVCDVAEFLTFKNDMLTSSAIFFDTKALAEFMAQE